VVITPAVALKLALLLPDVTVTEPGTVNNPEELERLTATPPVPAAFDSVTEQAALLPELSVVGLHDTALTVGGAESEMDAVCVPPFRVAVTTAV